MKKKKEKSEGKSMLTMNMYFIGPLDEADEADGTGTGTHDGTGTQYANANECE